MTARVTVVIPNWNGLAHLPECIEALLGQSYTDFEVVVVDNGSTDDSVAWLREHAAWVRVVERGDNGGFAVAVNEGIRQATGEYVALLNNDTAVDPKWLAELVGALEETGYDAAASLMVFYDEPHLVNAAGDEFVMTHLFGRNRGFGRPVEEYAERVRVLGACAGAALYRTSFFRDVGLFDEAFFLMHEDTDINLRALIAGKRCVYVPSALVRHKFSASIKTQPSDKMQRLLTRNEAFVLAKDLPAVLYPYAFVTLPYRLFRSVVPLRPSQWHRVPGLLRRLPDRIAAQREGRRMGAPKRADVWSRRAVPVHEIVRWMFRGVGPV